MRLAPATARRPRHGLPRRCALRLWLATAGAFLVAVARPVSAAPVAAPAQASADWHAYLSDLRATLQPLDRPLPPAAPGDWRAEHAEAPLPFERLSRRRRSSLRHVLYLQVVGDLSRDHQAILRRAQTYLATWFWLPVRRLPDLPDAAVDEAWQLEPQWHAPTVLYRLLRKRLPADGVALLAFTASDLTASAGSTFVYGLAMPRHRVGIWSLHRLGDPATDAKPLRRALVTTIHETGHLLGLEHCDQAACVMNGANHRDELDGTPLVPCADHAASFLWVAPFDAVLWASRLADLLRSDGFDADAGGLQAIADRMEGAGMAAPSWASGMFTSPMLVRAAEGEDAAATALQQRWTAARVAAWASGDGGMGALVGALALVGATLAWVVGRRRRRSRAA